MTTTELSLLVFFSAILTLAGAENPYLYYTWKVAYGIISPLGVPEKVILINDQFPGPNINSTTNDNIVVNVFNNLDVPFLFTWNGLQHRKNSWMDGTRGTNCPIMPGTNFTYKFQMKDQIGSYFYSPSIGLQRASGAYGGMRINSRMYIPVPFPPPEDDYAVLIGDWYRVGFAKLEKRLNKGRLLGRPAGVLINGKPGKHNPKAPTGLEETEFVMKPDMTYRFRICNVGVKVSLNIRIQGHTMNLVEIDGSHVVENDYESLDVHVGQCYSVLVKADKKPGSYYIVASTRFTKYYLYATALIKYTNADKKALPSPTLPPTPHGWLWSRNQWDSFRWNLTASAARPNPQGSYHYGTINISRTIILRNTVETFDGKLRTAINGKSFTFPNDSTPLKLSEYYGIADKQFKYNAISDVPPPKSAKIPVTIEPIIVNVTFRDFVEIIFENPGKSLQSYHLNGYSFFPVGMGCGKWSPEKRKGYNKLDAVSRHTIQVYQGSWTAILVTFDNCGMWNMRSDILERSYLGQELYFSVLSDARSLRDEYSLPERVEKNLCGKVVGLPTPPPYT